MIAKLLGHRVKTLFAVTSCVGEDVDRHGAQGKRSVSWIDG